jgi:hypothetical protein
LQEARKHEKPGGQCLHPLPNGDIAPTKEFLASHEELLETIADALFRKAMNTEGAIDFDVRDALAALIRTYRTMATGIQYETRPENRLAAGLYAAVQNSVAAFRSRETKALGMLKTRDGDVLRLLVFFQHFELDRNNGRPRGRAFLNVLRDFYPEPPGEEPHSASPLFFP